MRSVLILGLATGLLVGCGNDNTQVTATEQCIESYAVYENFSKTASSFDIEKAKAMAKANCSSLLNNEKVFEKIAMLRFQQDVPDYAQYEIIHQESYFVEDVTDWYLGLVLKKKNATDQPKKVYGVYFDHSEVKWKPLFVDYVPDIK